MTATSESLSPQAMEVIRGRERDCRQEVRSAVERGGTRPTRRVDPQRQAFRAAADEGPHPAEGGRIGTRRRLERRPDCRGAGHQHRHYRADQAPAGRGGVRGGVEAQIQSQSARAGIFGRGRAGKFIALDPSPAPEGFARWSVRLLEEKVVELHIVERASDNTIGRTLKKTFSNRIASSNGGSRRPQARPLPPTGKACGRSTRGRTIRGVRSCVSTKPRSS